MLKPPENTEYLKYKKQHAMTGWWCNKQTNKQRVQQEKRTGNLFHHYMQCSILSPSNSGKWRLYEDSLLYSNIIILVVPVTGWVGGGVDSKSKYPSIGPFPGIFRVTETSRRLLVFVENTEVSLTMGGWAGSKSTEKRPLRVSKTKKNKKKHLQEWHRSFEGSTIH